MKTIEELIPCVEAAFPQRMEQQPLYVAVFTDELKCGVWPMGGDSEIWKLLSVRVFTEGKEFKAERDYLDEDFLIRALDDSVVDDKGWLKFEETHLLDIDTRKTKAHADGTTTFHTMSGGAYTLPVSRSVTKVKVCTYFKSSEYNSVQYPVDWRIIGFE